MNFLLMFLAVIAALLGVGLAVFLFVKLIGFVGQVIAHVFRFVGGEIGDAFRLIGSLLLVILYSPMAVGNIVIGRWSAASHFGNAIKSEFGAAGSCCYRMVIGHPARLLLLTSLTEGLERRLPEVMANAPTRDRPKGSKASNAFDGYTIVGSLTAGGSGGKLYVAEPDDVKLAGFARNGQDDVDRVVIKTFNLQDGSSLPQIVRERRALDAAKKLGLVLEHDLTDDRFFYVMRYVPGEPLGGATQKLHNSAGPDGLDARRLKTGLHYVADLLETLGTYHSGGLWHKDVKPDNIIIHDERAHLVDLGLVSELRSAMTLTTHGTEYFRDPELVRMALKGVKVNQVDGGKFDIYAVGAVLFSVIENSFPAHGGLSQVTKKCPESLRWVIRRSMAEYDQRYANTDAMLVDVNFVMNADDPFAVRPADLPSMKVAGNIPEIDNAPDRDPAPGVAQAAAYQAANEAGYRPQPEAQAAKGDFVDRAVDRIERAVEGVENLKPGVYVAGIDLTGKKPKKGKLRVVNWWTGGYVADDGPQAEPAPAAAEARRTPQPPRQPERDFKVTPVAARRPAHEQLASARARAHARRENAQARRSQRQKNMRHNGKAPGDLNGGIGAALVVVIVLAGIFGLKALKNDGVATTVTKIESRVDGTKAAVTSEEAADRVLQAFDQAMGRVRTASGEFSGEELAEVLAGVRAGLEHGVNDLAKVAERQAQAPNAPNAPTPPLLTGHDVIIVNGFTPPFSEQVTRGLAEGVGEFSTLGANVLNDTDLIGDLRYVRGETLLDSDDTRDAVYGWIKKRETPTIVVWIEPKATGPDAGDAPPVEMAVFTSEVTKTERYAKGTKLSTVMEDAAEMSIYLSRASSWFNGR